MFPRQKAQVAPAPNNGAATENDLSLIAENAKKQQAEEQSRVHRESVIGKYKTEIKQAVDFISGDTREQTLLQTANDGNTSYPLFSITAYSFDDHSDVFDKRNIIKAHLDQTKDFLSRAEKNNRKLEWRDSTSFNRNPFNGEVTRTGSLDLILTFTPPQEMTPTPKAQQPAATNNLFLIAKNAQKQKAEEQNRVHRESVIGKYQAEIKQAVDFISGDTLEKTLLQTAHDGNKFYRLFSITAYSFEDHSDVFDKRNVIKAHLDQTKDFLSKAEKNNRKLEWKDSTSFDRNPFNGDVTRTGSLDLILTFTPQQEITPSSKAEKAAKSSRCALI